MVPPIRSLANVVAVASGGALGSLARYGLSISIARIAGASFPWGTLLINVTASFVLGALAELFALRWDASPEVRLLLVVGFCGGYSTFSTYSLELLTLLNRGALAQAIVYAAGSVVLSLAALIAALRVVRALV
jgi:fluoride exporter